jgi:hypothetical protein
LQQNIGSAAVGEDMAEAIVAAAEAQTGVDPHIKEEKEGSDDGGDEGIVFDGDGVDETERAIEFLKAIPRAVKGMPKEKQMLVARALPGALKNKLPADIIHTLQDEIIQQIDREEQENRAREVIKAAKEAGKLRKACAQCKKAGKFKACVRCSSVCYCNKKCQKAHWKVHKKQCANLAQATDGGVAHPEVLKAYDDLERIGKSVKAGTLAWGHEDASCAIFQFKNTMKGHGIPQSLQDGMFTIASGLPLSGVRQSRNNREAFLKQHAGDSNPEKFHKMATDMQNAAIAKLGLDGMSEGATQFDRAFNTADGSDFAKAMQVMMQPRAEAKPGDLDTDLMNALVKLGTGDAVEANNMSAECLKEMAMMDAIS